MTSKRTNSSTRHHLTLRKDTSMFHIELRLADVAERQQRFHAIHPRRRAGRRSGPPLAPPPGRPVARAARPRVAWRRDDRSGVAGMTLRRSASGPGSSRPGVRTLRKDTPLALADARAEGVVRLRRAQLLPHPPVLGVGARVPRLLRRRRALDLADRRGGGRRPPAAHADHRRRSSGTTCPSCSRGSRRRSASSAGRARSSTPSWRRSGAGPSSWARACTRWATASCTRR